MMLVFVVLFLILVPVHYVGDSSPTVSKNPLAKSSGGDLNSTFNPSIFKSVAIKRTKTKKSLLLGSSFDGKDV